MSFEVSAEAYDAFMGRWSRLLAPGLADLAGIEAGKRVLDVGCGTGALTEELVRRVGAGSVSAIDPSSSFVQAIGARLPGVDVRRASAESLPFDDRSFDAVLAQLVVHFMADPVAGLAEMARVTRRGGVVVASVWDHAGGQGPLAAFWDAAREVEPGTPDESDLPGVREGDLPDLFAAAGLHDVASSALRATIEHPDFEAWWEPFTLRAGPAGDFVGSLDPDRREALRRACARRLGSGPITVSAVAWAARGGA